MVTFTTRLIYDESKHAFEKKGLKIKIKSDTPKSKLIGKEKIDLGIYCDINSEVTKEDKVILSDKKGETCIVNFQITSKNVSRQRVNSNSLSPEDIKGDRLDDTSVSELTEFDDVSTEEDSSTTIAEFTTPEPDEKTRKRRSIGRSSTIGVYEQKSREKGNVKFLDDSNPKISGSGSKPSRHSSDSLKEIKQLKDTIAEHEKTIELLKSQYETSRAELENRYENQIKALTDKVSLLESQRTESVEQTSYKPVTAIIGPPSEESKISLMVLLILFLILCVAGEVQRLFF